ncbi:hypothetical protein FOMPIDRAFT_1119905 [Fomitopsis schrenkii]|uniref:Uncharacterized protein n=1 Tax=Fomitopsis schrenkii TaxID=2126942 RepID=S8FJT1_FOMSC|nr:hypothetical protein FOMPIDRAFT_1119905 [Fomitopsis schrenkii]
MAPTDPNFPAGLDIQASVSHGRDELEDRFGEKAQTQAIETYGIAGRVWEASYTMLAYLDSSQSAVHLEKFEFDPPPFTEILRDPHHAPADNDGLAILELGSGTGLIAARIASYLRDGRDVVVATDLPEVCELLKKNLLDYSAVKVHPLSWGSNQEGLAIASTLGLGSACHLTHIICSDLVYFPFLLAPLLRTLLHLTSEPIVTTTETQPTVIISYKIRSLAKETPFWAAFGLWFAFAPVLARRGMPSGAEPHSEEPPWERFVPATGQDDSFVFVAQRRPESKTWDIPEIDDDLLGGVGAWGNQDRKSDDTFETMLLMSLDAIDD